MTTTGKVPPSALAGLCHRFHPRLRRKRRLQCTSRLSYNWFCRSRPFHPDHGNPRVSVAHQDASESPLIFTPVKRDRAVIFHDGSSKPPFAVALWKRLMSRPGGGIAPWPSTAARSRGFEDSSKPQFCELAAWRGSGVKECEKCRVNSPRMVKPLGEVSVSFFSQPFWCRP